MPDRTYRASLSQSQRREGWSVIFRHPVRTDPATGRPGRRVRRGLGTKDREEAEQLVSQLNEILADQSYWQLSARAAAEGRFDRRVVEIFYQDLAPETWDFFAVRESMMPLPSSQNSDYRRVLFVGTTGSGKTTLVRQLLGTNPKTERFPSTSTAKTTVADAEIILANGPYRAVVTFMPRDQVRDYVEECLSAAVLAAYRRLPDEEVLRRLLNHVDQRFRLSYVLGSGSKAQLDDDDRDEELDFDEAQDDDTTPAFDLTETKRVLDDAVAAVRILAQRHADKLRQELGAKEEEEDQRVIEEIFEDNLDHLLREDEDYFSVADRIMEEIERRFDLLTEGTVQRTTQGWPKLWQWETDDRHSFIRTVGRFSSNYALHFGTLLTPIVNGIRVSGPFKPQWISESPKLVLLDGEGLGHSPDSSSSLPTAVTKRFDEVDAVVLVDNGAQPMQAAPAAVMRGLTIVGQTTKLLFTFTHFDQVVGDNLPTFQAKQEHILASAENVLTSIGEQLGPSAERALRRRLESFCFFVGGIQDTLDEERRRGQRSVTQLRAMLDAIEKITEPLAPISAKPIYDKTALVLAVQQSAEAFHEAWRARLGKDIRPGVAKEHWTRIKALTRRLAEGWADEYDTLKPVADLHRMLQEELLKYIQAPQRWEGRQPTEQEQHAVFEKFLNRLSGAIMRISARRLRSEPAATWQDAFNQSGRGSSFTRASIITDQIYAPAAPIPSLAPVPDQNIFLKEILEAVQDAAVECSAELR